MCVYCLRCSDIVRPPGTFVPKALCFTRDVFSFLFFSPRDLRAPSADRHETLPRDRNMGALYNAGPKIRGDTPPKKLGAKNMQNSARFHTTSDFDREYLRNGTRYPKSEINLITADYSRVPPKSPVNFGPRTTENYCRCEFGPTQIAFLGDYISVLRGCWPLKF